DARGLARRRLSAHADPAARRARAAACARRAGRDRAARFHHRRTAAMVVRGRRVRQSRPHPPMTAADAIQISVFRYALQTIAEEMHTTVVRTGRSTNIKDRQDTSSAIYDAGGDVVAQSEVATPVHLGTTHAVVRHLLG